MKYSIIIPAYNEEASILKTLKSYYNYFEKGKDFEIIVVCDGCTDRTAEIVRKFRKGKNNVSLLVFGKRLGKGGGVLAGFRAAKGIIIGFTDADGSAGPREFEKILKSVTNCECAIGSRDARSKRTVKRKILVWGFRHYVNFLFGMKIRDTQCGAKAFRKSAIESIINNIKTSGFSFDVEMLHRLLNKGYRIKEIPITWTSNTKKSNVKFRHIVEMFWDLLRLRMNF